MKQFLIEQLSQLYIELYKILLTGKQIPMKYISDVANVKRFKLGRPKDTVQADVFMKIGKSATKTDYRNG